MVTLTPTLTPSIAGMSNLRFSTSISTPMPTSGAAKNPNVNKSSWTTNIGQTRICFCEMNRPTNTPQSIRPIAETHRIKMSAPLPRTLSSLRNHKDRTIMKTEVHAQNSFVKLKASSKRYSFGEPFKTLHEFKTHQHI